MIFNNISINTVLVWDLINLILKMTNDRKTLFICKEWATILLQNSIICDTCNKVIKLYDQVLWVTGNDDSLDNKSCHNFYGTMDELNEFKNNMEIIRTYPYNLQFIKNPREKIILEAIKYDTNTLRYVPEINQTENICLQAVMRNGNALKYVINQTDKICLEAVKTDELLIEYIQRKTCIANWWNNRCDHCLPPPTKKNNVFPLVKNKTELICLEAVKYDATNFEFVPDEHKTEPLCLEAVKNDGMMLQYIPDEYKTEVICLEAVKNDGTALKYVTNQTDEICLEAVKRNWCILKYVKNQTDEICNQALKQDNGAIVYIRD